MDTETTDKNNMTLDEFQKKLFWIALYITTPIVAAYLYLYI